MDGKNEEPDTKKAKTTSSSISDALFGGSGDAATGSLSVALFGGAGDDAKPTSGQDSNEPAGVKASKPPPGSRQMTPPLPRKDRGSSEPQGSGHRPFDVTTSARFASQSTQFRQHNLAQDLGPGDEDGEDEVEDDGVDDDDGDGDGKDVAEEHYDDECEQEEEGPDGLTHSERLYLQREYETTMLTEREWKICQRRRRRLSCDAQIQTLSLCTETVGVGSMMPVKLWKDSAPDVIAANSKARKLSRTGAGNADDPYDLLHSDDEADGDRSLVLKRQQSLSICQAIMSSVGLLVIRNAQPSTASVAEVVDSDVEIVGNSGGDGDTHIGLQESIIPPDLMYELAAAAREIELELCERLDEKGVKWRALEEGTRLLSVGDTKEGGSALLVDAIPEDEMKMPSRETTAQEEEERRKRTEIGDNAENETSFRYHEVASRCIGRIDSRYRMDQHPFNDPRVTSNSVLLPIIRHMLGGENGNAELVYAGLIFSFPGSQCQPWHQDGEPLFPEEDLLDVPPYAFNVFIPLDDVDEEVGPTEFIPGTLLSDRAQEINEELVQWAMIESKWSGAGDHKASMRMVLGAEEDEWNSKNKVVAPLLRRGDAMIYDYRTCHRGTENLSQTKTRTMLYLMYARPWLKEHLNFGKEKLFAQS